MLKLYKLIILCFLVNSSLFAQPFDLIVGDKLPNSGFVQKIVLLKNGTVFYIDLNYKKIEKSIVLSTKVFATNCNVISEKKYSDVMNTEMNSDYQIRYIKSIFEMEDKIVVFVEYNRTYFNRLNYKIHNLVRYTFDAKDGSFLSRETIFELDTGSNPKYSGGFYDDHNYISYYVRKSYNDSAYGVVIYNGLSIDKDECITVMHYNAKHDLLSKTYLVPESGEFDYVDCMNIIVKGIDYIIVGAYANKGKLNNVIFSKVYLAKIIPGDKRIEYLDFPIDNFASYHFCEFFEESNQQIKVFVKSKFMKTSECINYKFSFDASKFIKLDFSELTFREANHYYITNVSNDPKKAYKGEIQDFINDGSNGYTIMTFNTYHDNLTTELSDFILTSYTKNWEEKYCVYVPLNYKINTYRDQLHFLRTDQKNNSYSLSTSEEYSADMRSGVENYYVFFNNSMENFLLPESKKQKFVFSLSMYESFYYVINKESGKVEKGSFFDNIDPKNRKKCNFLASDYNVSTNEYFTIMSSTENNKKYISLMKFKLK